MFVCDEPVGGVTPREESGACSAFPARFPPERRCSRGSIMSSSSISRTYVEYRPPERKRACPGFGMVGVRHLRYVLQGSERWVPDP